MIVLYIQKRTVLNLISDFDFNFDFKAKKMFPKKKSFKKERFSHCQEKAVLLRTDNLAEEKTTKNVCLLRNNRYACITYYITV